MERLTVDYGRKFSPFRYAMNDGSDSEIGYFKNYDAFYSHMLMVQKLGEYEDLEEQGLLIRLPCPIGTKVYNTTWWDDVTEKVKVDGKTFYRTVHKHKVSKSKFSLLDICDFGKTVFLTKEEAEQKLKEMEESK